jgi:putative transposase
MDTGHHRLRIGRCSLPGQAYHVTFCTQGRRRWFDRHDIAQTAVTALLAPHHWADAQLLTWVLMPDHWHGLIVLGHTQSLSDLIGHIKGGSAHAIGRHDPARRPVWQAAFHDHALRREETLHEVARYIVYNPVRAGLVDRPAAYPWWDSHWRDAFTP